MTKNSSFYKESYIVFLVTQNFTYLEYESSLHTYQSRICWASAVLHLLTTSSLPSYALHPSQPLTVTVLHPALGRSCFFYATPTHKSKYGTLLICAWILVFSRSFPVQYFFKNSIILLLWLIFYDVFYHLFLIYSCVDGHMVEFLSWCYGECSNKQEYRCPWHTCFTTSSVWVCYISIE